MKVKALRVIPGDVPDPTIIRDGEWFYLTCSSLRYYPGLLIYRSKNLTEWEPVCRALNKNLGDIWAPELVKRNGRYYIYFPAYKNHETRNYVIWSDRIDGGWSEPEYIGVSYMIDPGFVTDGKDCWIYFNESRCGKLDSDGLHITEKPVPMKEPWQYPEDWKTEGMYDESPKLFYKNGYYYMITAQGGTAGPATSHMAVCFRAETPLGKWEVSPYNPVIHTYSAEEEWWSTGHATYFEDENGDGYFVFHGYQKGNRNMGRQILLCRAKWTEDGFPIAEEIDKKPLKIPDFYDDFKDGDLDINWSFYGEYDPERFKIDLGLCLNACGNSLADSRPLTVNGRFKDYEVEVCVEKISENASAGTALYYNEDVNLGIYAQGKTVYVSYLGEITPFAEIASENVYFKIVKSNQRAQLFYSEDGTEYHRFAKDFDVGSFEHNVHKGFLSCRPSLVCFGEGKAVFKKFSYFEI